MMTFSDNDMEGFVKTAESLGFRAELSFEDGAQLTDSARPERHIVAYRDEDEAGAAWYVSDGIDAEIRQGCLDAGSIAPLALMEFEDEPFLRMTPLSYLAVVPGLGVVSVWDREMSASAEWCKEVMDGEPV